ncbi:MAG: dehydrogenase [Cytophagia bacterium]|nr:MAG: dehydrogenase [Cytophagales bacterium]TAG36116.1 MAG: dehydrogenase [Cytophagia bacterium]TAG77823.1 MAG: dehydrogenase [Cytophagales bacterium]
MKKRLIGSVVICTIILGSFTNSSIVQDEYRAETAADSNQLYLPDDLEATLWAEAPMLYNPTNMDVDARGRVWITEAVNYREFNNKPDQKLSFSGGDRVVILEDTDGDGKADKTKTFVQDKDLVAPLGIAVIGNKTVVSCSPHVIVYTDENGDDVPDKKEILLTGFGGLDHDHALHSVTAGPDGNWHFNTGNAGPHTVTDKNGWTLRSGSLYTGGSPHNDKNNGNRKSDDGRVWVGGLALRMSPEGKNLKVMAHNFRNSYEVAIDSYGNYWQNDNDDQVIACRTSWVMEGSNAGYFSADGTRYWQADRRPDQAVFDAHWHQEDPGVLPVGDNTGAGSPTGMLVYEDDALGLQYRGMVLSCEAGRNVVFAYWPKPKGAGYEMGKRTDLLSSFSQVQEHYIWHETGQDKRKWFRPSDAAAGTDGSLFVADWYDPVVGGHAMHDKKGYGRIYRITPKNKKLTPPKIDLTTTEGQIAALKNPAINVRNLGFEALKAQGEKVIVPVKQLLKDPNPFVQARAVWLLTQLGSMGQLEVLALLKGNVESVKLVAFRALKEANPYLFFYEPLNNKPIILFDLVKDSSAAMRREVAIAVRDMPYDWSKPFVIELSNRFDGQDRYYLEALGIALDGKEDQFYKDVRPNWPKNALDWTPAQAWIAWRTHPKAAINDLKIRANSPQLLPLERKRAITALAFVKNKEAALAMLHLSKSNLKDVAEQAFYWVNFRKTNDWQDLLNWQQATAAQLTPQQKKMLQFSDQMLNAKAPQKQRARAAQALALDPFGAKLLVTLASEYKIPEELKSVVAEYIFSNPDKSIRMLATDYFARVGGKQLSASLAGDMPADASKGQVIFANNCAICHRYGGNGQEIGPDLSGINKKFDKMGLLDAIINPSASMVFGYEPWIIQTKDKNSYYGFVVSDGATVVLKDATGQTTALKASNITSRKQLKNSLMPEPSAMGLKEKDLSDLAGYLLQL